MSGGGGILSSILKPVTNLLFGEVKKPDIPAQPAVTGPTPEQIATQKAEEERAAREAEQKKSEEEAALAESESQKRAKAALVAQSFGGNIKTTGAGVEGTAPVRRKTLFGE